MKTKPKTFSPWFYTGVVLVILGGIIFLIGLFGYLFNEVAMAMRVFNT